MEQPPPDDKNWTWVLERPCPDCRFDARTIARHAIGATLGQLWGAWQEVLSRGELVRQRPPGGRMGHHWSALEYGCHVRHVFVLFDERLRLMLTQQDPTFLNWDQDATAIAKRYWEDDPLRSARRCARRATAWPTPSTRCATSSGPGPARAPTGHGSPSNRLVGTCCTIPYTTCGM